VSGNVTCRIIQPITPIKLGDEMVITGQLQPYGPPLVPGQIDSRALLARQGVYFRLESSGGPRLVRKAQETLAQYLSSVSKRWVYNQLRLGIEDDPQVADTLTGMLIGYRESLPQDVEDDFRHTGTLHVFAVSGQNVSEVAELGSFFYLSPRFCPGDPGGWLRRFSSSFAC
jgi:predicted membrane metal-binding protein